MKVHKITLAVIDFDDIGAESVKHVIENARYQNHCISPDVISIKTADCGEWSDEHPLNDIRNFSEELERIFK